MEITLLFIRILLILTLCYTGIMVLLSIGWMRLRSFRYSDKEQDQALLTVVVPCKDESRNVDLILSDLMNQDRPSSLYEVIVVDDHSEDDTLEKCRAWASEFPSIKVVSSQKRGKKHALASGIRTARGKYIVTTDADCRIKKSWLRNLGMVLSSEKKKMMIMPVFPMKGDSWKEGFFSLEFLALQGVAGGAAGMGDPMIGSGAALAFEKAAYEAIGGYKGNKGVSSGDDVFLIHSFKKAYPGKVGFWKDEQKHVSTRVPSTWWTFFQQRARWGGKALFFKDLSTLLTSGVAFFAHFFLFAGLVLLPIFPSLSFLVVVSLGLKLSVDVFFLFLLTSAFKENRLLRYFLPGSLALLLLIPLEALVGVFFPGKWKGRKVQMNLKERNGKG